MGLVLVDEKKRADAASAMLGFAMHCRSKGYSENADKWEALALGLAPVAPCPGLPEGWEPCKSDGIHISAVKKFHRGATYAVITRDGVQCFSEHDDTSQQFAIEPPPEVKAYLEHQWAPREVI